MRTGHGNSICEMCSPAQHVEPRWRCAGLSALAVMIPVCFALLQTLAAHAQSPQTAEDVAGNDAVKAHIKSCIPSGQTVVPGEKPLSPQESLKRFTVADGLEIELVAAEPDVRQPVCLNFDERGRMWVVQYLQYPFPAGLKIIKYDEHLRAVYDKVPAPPPRHVPGADKVTIFEDRDGDGVFETHKDFVTGLNIATSALPGRGGVYILNPPYLLFYPDRDHDDIPDGDPLVLLEGFGIEDTHAVANSLTWGPDGWLYGAQGSTCTATIRGRKIYGQFSWRFHPATFEFEVFAEGAGNTFCLEFDRKGRLFSGTNIGNRRGSYYVQGGYYERTFSKHGPFTNPHTYGYFPHMNHEGDPNRFSHSLIVYEGGGLPARVEGKLLSLMPLQNQVQVSSLLPDGSSFRTLDAERLIETTDKWFRPVDIKAGPDGAVYVADWYDIRLTHADPRDNWDRSNGRIYRLKARGSAPAKPFDLARRSGDELLLNLSSPNKWLRQQTLRLLGDRRDTTLVPRLLKLLDESAGQPALEALWALNLCGGFGEDFASHALNHADPFVRLWTVRLLGDGKKVSPAMRTKLIDLARAERNVEVRSQLVCSARRLPASDALPIIQELAQHSEDIKDPHLPLLLWWAAEDKAISDRALVLARFNTSAAWKTPLLAEHLLPRLVQRYAAEGQEPDLEAAAALMRNAPGPSDRGRLLAAFSEGCKGRGLKAIPASLREVLNHSADDSDSSMALLRLNLGIPQPADLVTALEFVGNDDKTATARRLDFIKALGQAGQRDAVLALLDALRTSRWPSVQREALAALQLFDDPQIGRDLLAAYPRLPKDRSVQPLALEVLSKRRDWARELARAVEANAVPRSDIRPELIERLRLHHDAELDLTIQKLWGATRPPPGEKQQRMAALAQVLTRGKGYAGRGKALFTAICATCHTLFGEGQKIGPDLTGYERDNLDFLLVSIVDPSAGIREEYTNYEIETTDGLLLSGYILKQTPQSVTIEDGQEGKVVVPRDHIKTLRASPNSRMPEGLLDALSDEQVRDLFAYLKSKGPVADNHESGAAAALRTIQPFFQPPGEFANQFGSYRSPLLFDDGSKVETPADWPRRRAEILREWHGLMGEWPPVIEKPNVGMLSEARRENFTQRRVRLQIAPDQTGEGWLLVPDATGPLPAVLVVFYEPETSAGLKTNQFLDFGYQLARRGFVTLNIGTPGGNAYKPKLEGAGCQPLSFHAYVAANCWQALANLPQVDRERIGVVGHSYGGKWAMFSAALWDKFACVAVSDPGIIFDESRPNVNYWEPWYLGFDSARTRRPGLPGSANPRTGAYASMIERGRDLHELHALIAPRPFLVSGGAEDQPSRWIPLNHALALNQFLGFTNRVVMTNRQHHEPNELSNAQLYAFFEHFLK